MKNHYLLAQIAHIIRQLMESGIKIYKKHKKKLKDISAKLFEIFRTRINKRRNKRGNKKMPNKIL